MFRLKKGQESFTCMGGPFEGRTFKPGKVYAEIPPAEAKRFEEIAVAAAPAENSKPAKADKQKAAKEPAAEKNEEV